MEGKDDCVIVRTVIENARNPTPASILIEEIRVRGPGSPDIPDNYDGTSIWVSCLFALAFDLSADLRKDKERSSASIHITDAHTTLSAR